jgi:hypothetical protein
MIEGMALPFDPQFGLTGGEDNVFFNHLQHGGARMTWCREAVVFETVPSSRANLLWTLKRAFRYGIIGPRVRSCSALDLGKVMRAAYEIVRLSCAALMCASVGIASPRYAVKAMLYLVDDLQLIALRLGNMACYAGLRYEEYRGR